MKKKVALLVFVPSVRFGERLLGPARIGTFGDCVRDRVLIGSKMGKTIK